MSHLYSRIIILFMAHTLPGRERNNINHVARYNENTCAFADLVATVTLTSWKILQSRERGKDLEYVPDCLRVHDLLCLTSLAYGTNRGLSHGTSLYWSSLHDGRVS